MLLHTFTNILVKKFLGNNLVPRFLCFPYYKCITHFVLFFTQAFCQEVHSVLFFYPCFNWGAIFYEEKKSSSYHMTLNEL